MKDRSYRSTPVGLEVAHFIRWFRNEFGATSEALRDYEAILAKARARSRRPRAPRLRATQGTTRLREFIDERWGDAAPQTRVSTTANIYVQGSPADLEDKLRKVWGE